MGKSAGLCALTTLGVGISAPGVAVADVSFTPRLAVYFDNVSQRQTATQSQLDGLDLDQIQQVEDHLAGIVGPSANYSITVEDAAFRAPQVNFNVFGGTISFGMNDDKTTVALTALHGATQSTVDGVLTAVVDFSYDSALFGGVVSSHDLQTQNLRHVVDLKRSDVELSIQHRGENFALVGGARVERVEMTSRGRATGRSTENLFNLISNEFGGPFSFDFTTVEQEATSDATYWSISGRIGGAAYAPISDRQRLYANAMVHIAYSPEYDTKTHVTTVGMPGESDAVTRIPSEVSVGPDLSVGYQLTLSERTSLDLRYRATVYFPVSGPSDFEDPRVNHGLMLGLTMRLG